MCEDCHETASCKDGLMGGGREPPTANVELAVSTNLDLVRSTYTAFERGDFSSTEWAHPEIKFEGIGGDLDEPVRVVGVAEMVASYRGFLRDRDRADLGRKE